MADFPDRTAELATGGKSREWVTPRQERNLHNTFVQHKESNMKRKPMLAPRNPLVVAAKFRKAGAHEKSTKALRREQKMNDQREVCRVARHPAFNRNKDGFESLISHQIANA